jgi:hypothetical protein
MLQDISPGDDKVIVQHGRDVYRSNLDSSFSIKENLTLFNL